MTTTLADAAALMRTRAEAAAASNPGAWLVGDVEATPHTTLYYIRTEQGGYDGAVSEVIASESAARHIAAFGSPAVALAVADLIAWHDAHDVGGPSWRLAHAVAWAYVGGVAT